MNKRNYQKEMDSIIANLSDGVTPKILLHSCCAPCSSYVLEYLSEFFLITVMYYNPNITNESEYEHRLNEQKRLCSELAVSHSVDVIAGEYLPKDFYRTVRGLEKEPEGGERCRKCFELRLEYTAEAAKRGGFDYFATTLTLSPLKNAALINEIGERLAKKYGVKYLCSDFKKREGYKRSIELSRIYGLYRQNYCGCEFSKRDKTKYTV